jgi:hypothetical protein
MVPGLEDMGIPIFLNECEPLSRGSESIYLAGVDDAHFYLPYAGSRRHVFG